MCSGMTAPVKRDYEAEWNAWLRTLPPWELHYLTTGDRELDWHDDFVSGEVELDTLVKLLARNFEHSLRV